MMSEAARKSLATKLNAMIDIPMMGEEHEQMIAEKLIDMCLGSLESSTPSEAEIVEANGNPEKQKDMQSSMVQKLNGMIDIPFANEEQEAMVLNLIVDYFIKDKMGKPVADSAADAGAS